MPPDFLLRPATHADGPAVQALVFGILAEYHLQADPETTDADLFDLLGHYQNRGGSFDVVTDAKGQIIASVGLQPHGPGVCELRKMYVLPACRGQGLGRRLLKHAITRARELGFQEMVLETAEVLKEAVSMYEQAGFLRYEAPPGAARCDAAYRLVL